MKAKLEMETINTLAAGTHKNPHSVIGMHLIHNHIIVRAWQPHAKSVELYDVKSQEKWEMPIVDARGAFELALPGRHERFLYQFIITTHEGHIYTTYDPYSFWPTLSEFDLHLFNEGNHHKIYEKLGCHLRDVDGIAGASFTVWAPAAQRVSVVGSFNQWDGRRFPMRRIGSSGVWEIFLPGICKGDVYKYEILTPNGEIYLKADPYAFYAELPSKTASVCYDLHNHEWQDAEWIKQRTEISTLHKPVNIYEVHAGSWKTEPDSDPESETGFKPYSWKKLADSLIPYAKEMGYTHIEFMPVMEHPFDGSWGYQVTGYYAATSRYGTPEDFKEFIDRCHLNNIGVILDWVPAHFPKDGHGLPRFDGTALYEHHDPRQGEHEQWGTHIFNFGRQEVKNFLVSNAVYWFDQFHIDGLRVDAVASMLYLDYARPGGDWIPNKFGGRENIDAVEFIKNLNTVVYEYFPNVMMIAEESTSWPMVTTPVYQGGLGFSHKWNMGWMNDFLKYMGTDSLYRRYNQHLVTFSFMYAWSENYVLVLSHDEVVHGKKSMLNKMPGDYWQQFAGLRAAYGYFFGHPGKKLLFMGSEFGQYIEWKYKTELDWFLLDYDMHQKMRLCVNDLNHLYVSEKALYEIDTNPSGFEWIDCTDIERSIVSFIRKGLDWRDMLVIICNFTPAYHHAYRVGAPLDTTYTEIFNSDLEKYGGSNARNEFPIAVENVSWQQKPFSMLVNLPPLSTIILRPDTSKLRD
jgi:1,4-alpha-glucan branching enzyme